MSLSARARNLRKRYEDGEIGKRVRVRTKSRSGRALITHYYFVRKYSRKKGSLNWVLQKYSKNRRRLTVKKMGRDTVLIEGSAKALRFLGEVLIAHAKEWDCKFHLDPKGGGSWWFKKGSTLGLYLHRLPCYWKKRHRRKR